MYCDFISFYNISLYNNTQADINSVWSTKDERNHIGWKKIAYTDQCKWSHGFLWMYKWDSRAWRYGILLWSMHENRRSHRCTSMARAVRSHDTIWPIANCIWCLSCWPWCRHVLSYWTRLLFDSNRWSVRWTKLGKFSVVVNSRGIEGLNCVWASTKSKSRIKSLNIPVQVTHGE